MFNFCFTLNRKTRVGPAAGLLTRSPRYPQKQTNKKFRKITPHFFQIFSFFETKKNKKKQKIESSVAYPPKIK
jgi:hypothetical protein